MANALRMTIPCVPWNHPCTQHLYYSTQQFLGRRCDWKRLKPFDDNLMYLCTLVGTRQWVGPDTATNLLT